MNFFEVSGTVFSIIGCCLLASKFGKDGLFRFYAFVLSVAGNLFFLFFTFQMGIWSVFITTLVIMILNINGIKNNFEYFLDRKKKKRRHK